MRNVYFTSLLMLCMSVHVKAGDWMKRLPDNLFVSQVSIPGTHDAATGNGVTLASYSQCQDIDVATQWSIGIRAFDFRPKVKGDYQPWDCCDQSSFRRCLVPVAGFVEGASIRICGDPLFVCLWLR